MRLMKAISDSMTAIIVAFVVFMILWVIAAQVVCTFQNPWMTDAERMIHFFDVMQFEKLNYEELRPRG